MESSEIVARLEKMRCSVGGKFRPLARRESEDRLEAEGWPRTGSPSAPACDSPESTLRTTPRERFRKFISYQERWRFAPDHLAHRSCE